MKEPVAWDDVRRVELDRGGHREAHTTRPVVSSEHHDPVRRSRRSIVRMARARQGLPVSTMGGGGSAAAPSPGSGPHAQPGSGPYGQSYGQPGSGPNRGAPPAPPRGKQASVPPPVAEEMHEVEEAEMIEEQY